MAVTFNMYPFGWAEILRGDIDLLNDTIEIVSVESGFSFNNAHQFLDDLTGTLIDAHAGVALGSKAINNANGHFTAADVAIPGVAGGTDIIGFLMYNDTGNTATSQLIGLWTGPELTYSTNGQQRIIRWSGGNQIIQFSPTSTAAGGVYDAGMAEIARTNIDVLTADLRILLIDEADYTFSQAHEDLADVAAGARVGTAVALSSKTISDAGLFDAATATLTSVSGDATEAALIYLHTGVEATSTLISYHTNSEIEVTPNGENIDIAIPNGILTVPGT